MLKDANNFLLFTEHRAAIDYLSDEDAGKLIKALFTYVDEGKLPDFNGPMMSLFMVIRTQIDRSHEAYKAKCEKNSANAKKRFATHSASTTASSGNPSQANVSERMPSHTDASLPNPKPNPNPKPIPSPTIDDGTFVHIINEKGREVDEEYPFDTIWEMYGKPVGDVEQLRQRWQELSLDEKKKIFEYVPFYVQARPEKKYRKDFANFLTCRTWETEVINQKPINNEYKYQYSGNNSQPNDIKRELAYKNAAQLVSKLIDGGNATSVDGPEKALSDDSKIHGRTQPGETA
ncbi:MAG: hypothetical protein IJ910_09410 [Bacteroidaceae bacterium]|nr:hypothetical protein [Bacteroidaceae bacterium]